MLFRQCSLSQSEQKKQILLIGELAILLLAIGVSTYSAIYYEEDKKTSVSLSKAVPSIVAGWNVTDEPIAATEEMKRAVGKILNYDDAIYRTYRKGNLKISIYLAYWKPKKMSYRDVSAHSPDNCWINSGWKRTYRAIKVAASYPYQNLREIEIGSYSFENQTQNVLFWHVYNNITVDYYGDKLAPWRSIASNPFKYGVIQKDGQYFLRISSNGSVNSMLDSEVINRLVRNLGPLFLYKSSDVTEGHE